MLQNVQLSVHKIRDSLHSPHTFKGVIASELEVLSWFCYFYGTKARLTHSLVRCPFPPPSLGSFYNRNYQYITNGERKGADVSPSASWKPEEIRQREKTNKQTSRWYLLNNKKNTVVLFCDEKTWWPFISITVIRNVCEKI